ncbi:MAG: hypothetical protein AB8B83_06975 [Bdellovibrionales bacterium]
MFTEDDFNTEYARSWFRRVPINYDLLSKYGSDTMRNSMRTIWKKPEAERRKLKITRPLKLDTGVIIHPNHYRTYREEVYKHQILLFLQGIGETIAKYDANPERIKEAGFGGDQEVAGAMTEFIQHYPTPATHIWAGLAYAYDFEDPALREVAERYIEAELSLNNGIAIFGPQTPAFSPKKAAAVIVELWPKLKPNLDLLVSDPDYDIHNLPGLRFD